ncbi:tetratricopeptide repeat protein [Nitrosovibrio sp. Nv4]|uniref:tetratricopeptide repeat protein n=1 Tax=Nitrosovibrio sp. Nv4 TaxID=1945880 RepID=UPI000BC75160|nr:tetratricopeptide repeat protein [Nitrosovibrio sp. Nv4]SOD41975.1 Tetratricopeptide repeat-containing protein [Nitrosovibrio sp. Nv4]
MSEMVSAKSPLEWTVAGALDEVASLDKCMPDRSIAFLLGSGASVSSSISSGKIMAENWLNELHIRECHDGSDRDTWIASDALGIGGLAWDCAAEFYPLIFERRFRGDPEAGFAALEAAMDGKEPSLGYSLLAEIMQQTRHKVVVTTNFDNLVADALAIHAHKPPLIVGHESLTGYVRAALRRPLVAKIHRDLFLHPKNDTAGVGTLEKGWTDALTRLFKHYMPLVIGYGGNDGSLMGFLSSLNPGDIAGRIIWCYQTDSRPSAAVQKLLAKHYGVMVAIPGFDEFMLRLAAKLIPNFDMAKISRRIEERGKQRAESYREQAENLQKTSTATNIPNVDQQATREVLADAFKDTNNWWSWVMRARAEADLKRRKDIYLEGFKVLPSSIELMNNYAIFLANDYKDFDGAEQTYKRALEANPKDVRILGNYARLLADEREDLDGAEGMFKQALEADPKYDHVLTTYAHFLANKRNDMAAADEMYQRALDANPRNAFALGFYANFLADKREDWDSAEVMYKRALEADPKDAYVLNSYANFLADKRTKWDAAELTYKHALKVYPKDRLILDSYANFLENKGKDGMQQS